MWQETFALAERGELALEDGVAGLGAAVIRVMLWVVPAWFADAAAAAVVDDRGIGDPSRNQDRARPGGTC